MTFASEAVRILYHQLPTDTQVRFTDMEETMAEYKQQLKIEAVMQYDRSLEVVIRITEKSNLDSFTSNTVS